MVLTVTEDTPADMLAGSMELLVQLPREHHTQTQRVTVQRSTPMMDLLVQIATAHKLAASSYTLQAIGERGLVLPHQPNTPIGALDALQVKLLPKQGTFLSRKNCQTNQPFETTFRLQVHLPRNQLYVSRVSPKTNLGDILDEVCREKNLDRNKYELRHPANLSGTLDLSLSLQDYRLQEVTLYARRGTLGSALSSQDIMALQRQEEARRQQARHSVFGFMFKKSKESSLSTDSLGNRSVSPAHSDETARSTSPVGDRPEHRRQQLGGLQQHQQQQQQSRPMPPPSRPLRKRRPAPKPPTEQQQQQQQQRLLQQQQEQQRREEMDARSEMTTVPQNANESVKDKDKIIISHSRNSSDSSGYHEASVLSDNPDNGQARMHETLPRRGRMQGILEAPRKLAQTSQASKSLGNLAVASGHGVTLSRGVSNTSLSSAGQRKKRAAPAPPMARPLPSAISAQGLERIIDSDESLTSDMELSKPSSDIEVGLPATGTSSKANSDIACHAVHSIVKQPETVAPHDTASIPSAPVDIARVVKKELVPPLPKPLPKPRNILISTSSSSSSASSHSLGSPAVDSDSSRLACSGTSSANQTAEGPGFRLPSLTEDEREEIAMAIDSIVEAATSHGDELDSLKDNDESSIYEDASENPSAEEGDVFGEAEASGAELRDLRVDAPPAFRDDAGYVQESPGNESEASSVDDVGSRADASAGKNSAQCGSSTNDVPGEGPASNDFASVADDDPGRATERSADLAKIESKPEAEAEGARKGNEGEGTGGTHVRVAPPAIPGVPAALDGDASVPHCAVISTIPKCDRVEPCAESGDFGATSPEPAPASSSKRGKIARSQSETTHSEVGSAERHGRHLTSNDGEVLGFVLNPSLDEAAAGWRSEAAIAGSGKAASPSDTDILLQKVSDTLSHALEPPSPPPTPSTDAPGPEPAADAASGPVAATTARPATEAIETLESASPGSIEVEDRIGGTGVAVKDSTPVEVSESPRKREEEPQTEAEEEVEGRSPTSSQNLTIGSQLDTSDYVSANGEETSIGDWEYQIPAPPSAFRDEDAAPSTTTTTTTTSGGEKAPPAKKPITIEAEVYRSAVDNHSKVTVALEPQKKLVAQPAKPHHQLEETRRAGHPKATEAAATTDTVDFCRRDHQPRQQQQQPPPRKPVLVRASSVAESTEQRRAEVISELESRINSKKPIVEPARDDSHAPRIAPVENNLSNFTITTYPKQKSMDIYEQLVEHHQPHREVRVINSFATLARGRSAASADYGQETRSGRLKSAQSMERVSVPLVEERCYFESSEIIREKPTVHRSQSYIVLSSNEKFQNRMNEIEKTIDEGKMHVDGGSSNDKSNSSTRFTSLANVNASTNEELPRHKEKFSQWRENMLKKVEEPSKEKQLQSLQVLKSILPQLKNAQALKANEDKTYKYNSDNFITNKRQEYQQNGVHDSPVVSSSTHISEVPIRTSHRSQEPAKRYTYGGPPTVSLGSWSERPCVNVQIKTDTDYKFGSKGSASGARTVVNLNAGERIQDGEVSSEKKKPEPEEQESRVDTTSVNFKELAKTFGQTDVRMRPKPAVAARNPSYRYSEYIERPKIDVALKQNGFAESHVSSTTSSPLGGNAVKRYTSIIGINGTNNGNTNNMNSNNASPRQVNFSMANGQPKVPTVKGFAVQSKDNDFGVPKAPTMPIITGVTLKSVGARPKPNGPTIQADPRDQLLESIRNFGGLGKLKNTADKY